MPLFNFMMIVTAALSVPAIAGLNPDCPSAMDPAKLRTLAYTFAHTAKNETSGKSVITLGDGRTPLSIQVPKSIGSFPEGAYAPGFDVWTASRDPFSNRIVVHLTGYAYHSMPGEGSESRFFLYDPNADRPEDTEFDANEVQDEVWKWQRLRDKHTKGRVSHIIWSAENPDLVMITSSRGSVRVAERDWGYLRFNNSDITTRTDVVSIKRGESVALIPHGTGHWSPEKVRILWSADGGYFALTKRGSKEADLYEVQGTGRATQYLDLEPDDIEMMAGLRFNTFRTAPEFDFARAVARKLNE